MSFSRFILVGTFLLGAACTADTAEDANVASETAEYRSNFHSIHHCMTNASADEHAQLVTWASVGLATRGSAPFLHGSLHLNMTDGESTALRASDPFTFTGGVSLDSPGTVRASATVDGHHYESADGSVSLELDLDHRHALDHGVVSSGRGTARVTFDFGATKQTIPARIRALGKQTFQLTLNDCD